MDNFKSFYVTNLSLSNRAICEEGLVTIMFFVYWCNKRESISRDKQAGVNVKKERKDTIIFLSDILVFLISKYNKIPIETICFHISFSISNSVSLYQHI